MLTAILSLLGSSAFGSILGGIFAFLNRKTDLESKKLDHQLQRDQWASDIAKRDKDIEYAKVEAAGAKEVAVAEADGRIEAARVSAIAAAQAADKVTAEELQAAGGMRWLLVLAVAFNKWIRPVGTVVLAVAAIKLNWLLISQMSDGWVDLTKDQRFDVGMQAFAWITGQASAALGYWFVSRGTSK